MIDAQFCGLSEETQQKLTALFRAYKGVEKVILYGSRAMGTFKAGSDIDLTILGQTLTLKDLLSLQNHIDDFLLPQKVDLSLYHLIDNPNVKDHIQRVGKLFYLNSASRDVP